MPHARWDWFNSGGRTRTERLRERILLSTARDISSEKLSVLSLFSGAGGMDVGLEAAGFEPIACLELEANARETLRLNRPDWNVPEDGDVLEAARELTPPDFDMNVGDLDLIAGGPPCQPFSTAAQWSSSGRKGMSDLRAETVHALLKLVRRFQPRALFLENVLGFVEGHHSALSTLKSGLAEINRDVGTSYSLEWQLLNSADYGVPQNRKRVIILAFRDGTAAAWPAPTHVGKQVTAMDAFAGLNEVDRPQATGKWKDLLPSIPEGHNYQWLTSHGGGEEVFGYRTKYWNFLLKLARNAPSWTLSASPGPSTGPFHWENRPLTPRERLRLQSFPDDWNLTGDLRQQIRLSGNATPALLAELVGRAIRSHLGSEIVGSLTLEIARQNHAYSGLPVFAVPAGFRMLIGEKAPHGGTGHGPAPRPIPAQVLP